MQTSDERRLSCVVGYNVLCVDMQYIHGVVQKQLNPNTMVNHKQGFVPLSGVLEQIKYFDRTPPRSLPVHILRKHSMDCFIFLSIVQKYCYFCANNMTFSTLFILFNQTHSLCICDISNVFHCMFQCLMDISNIEQDVHPTMSSTYRHTMCSLSKHLRSDTSPLTAVHGYLESCCRLVRVLTAHIAT